MPDTMYNYHTHVNNNNNNSNDYFLIKHYQNFVNLIKAVRHKIFLSIKK